MARAVSHTGSSSGKSCSRELGQGHKTVTCRPLPLPKRSWVLPFPKTTQTFRVPKPNRWLVTTELPDCNWQPSSRRAAGEAGEVSNLRRSEQLLSRGRSRGSRNPLSEGLSRKQNKTKNPKSLGLPAIFPKRGVY